MRGGAWSGVSTRQSAHTRPLVLAAGGVESTVQQLADLTSVEGSCSRRRAKGSRYCAELDADAGMGQTAACFRFPDGDAMACFPPRPRYPLRSRGPALTCGAACPL